MHVLIVEDDRDLLEALTGALEAHGCTVEGALTAGAARAFGDLDGFACVLLDLGLPDGSGLDLLVEWRRRKVTVPVIVVTAHDAIGDRIAGLEQGADDYVVKPMAIEELLARLRAVTRRVGVHTTGVWEIGPLTVEPRSRRVERDGREVPLSPKEYVLLVELARLAGRAVPKHRLAHLLSPFGEPVELGAVEFHVHNLRRKVGEERIKTIRGVGYRLELS